MASIFSSLFSSSNSVPNLDSETFETKLKDDDKGVLLDTRTQSEYNERHIPNSILIDFMDPKFRDEIDKLDRDKNYYLYCRSGNRSYHAAKLMLNMGFENVYNLADGIIGWHGEVE